MNRRKSTGQLVNELSGVSNIRDYFSRNNAALVHASLSSRLQELIDREGMSHGEMAARSGLDRYYLYDILRGRKIPSVDKLMCMILALEVDLNTAQELFRLAGRPTLYARYPRDSVFIYAIQRHLTVDKTNELLFESGQPLLTP